MDGDWLSNLFIHNLIKVGIKAKKKRLGGGGGGGATGTYPMSTNNSGATDNIYGIASDSHGLAITQSGLTHASTTFATITDIAAGGANVPPFTGSPIEIADYVATSIQSQSPINDAGGNPMLGGEITIPNIVGQGKHLMIQGMGSIYNPTNQQISAGSVFINLVTDTNNVALNNHIAIGGAPVTLNTPIAVSGAVVAPNHYRLLWDIEILPTIPACTSGQLIFEIYCTGIGSKHSNQPHSINRISSAIGSATYVGATYFGIIFS